MDIKTKKKRTGFWLIPFLLFGPAFILVLISKRGCEHKFETLEDYGKISNFILKSESGEEITPNKLNKNIYLITVMQESCPDSCSISFWHINQMIYQHLKRNQKKFKHVKLLSIITDGKGNPISNIKIINNTLKDQVEDYDPSIWMLLTGDVRNIYNISHNNKNLLQKGEKYFGGEAFQELMLLIDKKGHLRMVLNGKTEGMIRKMRECMALLDKQYDKENKSKL